jgi:hypothetical protein
MQRDILAGTPRTLTLDDLEAVLATVDPTDRERWMVREALSFLRHNIHNGGEAARKLDALLAQPLPHEPLQSEATLQLSAAAKKGPVTASVMLDAFETLGLDGLVQLEELNALRSGIRESSSVQAFRLTSGAQRLMTIASSASHHFFVEDRVVDDFIRALFAEAPTAEARRAEVQACLAIFGHAMTDAKIREVRELVGLPRENPLVPLWRAGWGNPLPSTYNTPGYELNLVVNIFAPAFEEDSRGGVYWLVREATNGSASARVALQLLLKADQHLPLDVADINRLTETLAKPTEFDLEALQRMRDMWAGFMSEDAIEALIHFIRKQGKDPSCADGPVVPECDASSDAAHATGGE